MLPRAEGSWCFVTSVVPAHVQAHGRQHDGLCAVASSDGGDGCKFAITCDSMRESRNILGIMVHRGPPGACRLVVPLPLPGRSPTRLGLGRSVGKRPDEWHQWHVEARARARNGALRLQAPRDGRRDRRAADRDPGAARQRTRADRSGGSRRGLYGTVPSASTSRPRLRLPTRPSAERSGAPTTWSAASFRYASSSAITGSPAVIASGCSSSVRAWRPR